MRRFPYYALALPAFFALHGYVQQYGLLPGAEALRLLAIYTLVAVLLLAAGRALTGSWRKAGILSFAVLAVELFYGAAYDAVHTRVPWLPLQAALVLTVTLLLPALLLMRMKRWPEPANWTLFANLLFTVFILFDCYGLFRRHREETREASARRWNTTAAKGVQPDVFLVIADEYAGTKEVRDLLHFDNSAFLDSLAGRGFQVDSDANSNYNYTEYSTASLLNGAYFPAASRTNATDVGRCFSWIYQNETLRFFRERGYSLHNLSFFDLDGAPSPAPRTWNAQWTGILRQQTLTGRMMRDMLPDDGQASFAQVNESLLRNTLALLQQPAQGPRFVYTHLLLPHSPYYFDSAGHPQPASLADDRNNATAYLQYLRYGNGIYLDLVDRILHSAKRPTVVLLLGDHGFRGFAKPVPTAYYFRNLFAVYTSPGLMGSWPQGKGLVNQFRILADSCFGQRLPLLPDEQHFIGTQFH